MQSLLFWMVFPFETFWNLDLLHVTRAAALRRLWNELPGPPFVAERVGRGKGTILVT